MELTWLKNTDTWRKLSFLPSASPGARIVGPLGPVSVTWETALLFHSSTVPSCLKFQHCPHPHQGGLLRLLWAPSACSPLPQKNWRLSTAWEEGRAEGSAGKRTLVEISITALLRQRLKA